MSDFIVNGGYQGDVSFYKQNGTVKRFNATPSKSAVGSLDGCLYGVVGLNDGNLQENYTAPYSQPVISQPALLGGTNTVSVAPQLRPRVVTYKLFFRTKSPKLNTQNQYAMLGRGVKQYVQEFVREFLDVGDLKVQYGTWGGVDLGGYLVDAPQAEYSRDGSQCVLSFVLQFVNPITLHPNFTDSVLWNKVTYPTVTIGWESFTSEDEGRLQSKQVTLNATTGALTATFSNVKRWSNLAYLTLTATSSVVQGILKIRHNNNIVCYRETTLNSSSTNRVTLFSTPHIYYYNVAAANNATALTQYYLNVRNYQAGVSAVPPTHSNERVTVTFTPNVPEGTAGQSNGRFMLLGW